MGVVGIIVGNFAGRVWQCNVATGRGARGEWLSSLQQRGRCGVGVWTGGLSSAQDQGEGERTCWCGEEGCEKQQSGTGLALSTCILALIWVA